MPPTAAPPQPSTLIHLRAAASSAAEITEQRDRKVSEALREGHSVAAVARAADLDRRTVVKIAERYGVDR